MGLFYLVRLEAQESRIAIVAVVFVSVSITCFTMSRTPPCRALCTTTTRRHLHNVMAPPHHIDSLQKEGRMALAIHSIKENQIKSQRKAAKVYGVRQTMMRDRIKAVKEVEWLGQEISLLSNPVH